MNIETEQTVPNHLADLIAMDPALRDAGANKDGGIVNIEPRRSLAEIEAAYAVMPPLQYRPPENRLHLLPKTMAKLRAGANLRIVNMGDSIANDLARSGWLHLLRRQYPQSEIDMVTSVRGATPPSWYRPEDRLRRYCFDHDPDLVILGGVSMRDAQTERYLIELLRRSSDAEIMLVTGGFGPPDEDGGPYFEKDLGVREELGAMAAAAGVEFLDLRPLWADYIRTSGKPLESFMRDDSHANRQGEQILGRILASYFSP